MGKAPTEAGLELANWMRANGINQPQLVWRINSSNQGFKISQPWLNRILAGRFKRFSGKAGSVFRYAGITLEADFQRDPSGLAMIESALDEAWDGSLEGARALDRLLRGAADLRRAPVRRAG